MSWVLAAFGLIGVSVGWVHYLWLIPREQVPADPQVHRWVLGIAAVLGLGGAGLGLAEGGLGPAIVFTASGGLAGLFFWLLSIAALPDGALAVAVGDRVLDFRALDSTGLAQGPEAWRGRRVLLKFFRGHW